MHTLHITKSTSTATTSTTSVTISGVSQPDLAAGQPQQGSFAGLSTTVHAPESTFMLTDDRDAGLRLLAEISNLQPQINPFEALATYQTVSLADDVQVQSASSLSLSDEPSLPNEPSQPTDHVAPIMVVEEPKPRSGQNPADQYFDPTDRWIIYRSDEIRPFQCGYKACNKTYLSKRSLLRHLVEHPDIEIRLFQCDYEGCGKAYPSNRALRRHIVVHSDRKLRCYSGDCTGNIRYRDREALKRHKLEQHTIARPFECDICNKRFRRRENLKYHQQHVHSTEKEQTAKKKQKHHRNERENN